MASNERDQPAADLLLCARSVGPGTEAAAWALIGARCDPGTLLWARRMIDDVVTGEAARRQQAGPSRPGAGEDYWEAVQRTGWAVRVPGRMEALGTLETAARREGWCRGEWLGATLTRDDVRRVRAMLRGKVPREV